MRGWKVVVSGIPRTKKNSPQLVRGRAVLFPSAAWRAWAKEATFAVCVTGTHGLNPAETPRPWSWAWVKAKHGKAGIPKPPTFVPGRLLLNCRATFFRDRAVGDAVGFYQGLGDLLEYRGIVGNDRQLVSWDGSRLEKDADHPRVELVLTETTVGGLFEFPDIPDEEPEDSEVGFGIGAK